MISISPKLVDSIGCDFPVENNAFVNIFTSQDVSTDYSDSSNGGLDQNIPQNTDCCLVSSQLSTSNDEILQQTDIETLDASLQNLPKDMYVGKLLEMCLNNENMICWYRNVLCSRARLQTDCPKGNLINRKTTKSGSSAQKYARDCHTLNCLPKVMDQITAFSFLNLLHSNIITEIVI